MHTEAAEENAQQSGCQLGFLFHNNSPPIVPMSASCTSGGFFLIITSRRAYVNHLQIFVFKFAGIHKKEISEV
jgi:hypothetical protein